MNAPVPRDDVDGITVPPPWAAPPRRTRKSRYVIAGVGVAGLLALGGAAVIGFRSPSSSDLYETIAVTRQDIESTVAATGNAKAAAQPNNVVLYTALFDVPNDDGDLRAGMTAQVFFVTAAAKGALVVPVASLTDGQTRVLVDGGIVAMRKVETGVRTRFLVEVKDGLADGERVITGLKAAGPPGKLRVGS